MTRCSATVQIGSHRYRCKLDEGEHIMISDTGPIHIADVHYRGAGTTQEAPGEFHWHAQMAAEDIESIDNE